MIYLNFLKPVHTKQSITKVIKTRKTNKNFAVKNKINDIDCVKIFDGKKIKNPLKNNDAFKDSYFVEEDTLIKTNIIKTTDSDEENYFVRAGPRKEIAWDPIHTKVAIVTCGGLCPGLNTVIRELYITLHHKYGVKFVYGVKNGYKGFYSDNLVRLDDDIIRDIHHKGGSILGTSRGGTDVKKIVDSIAHRGISHLYAIGGNGTQKGLFEINKEIKKRGLCVSVVGIPKTIDNDLCIIDKSFGFDTSVQEAQRAIQAAKVEIEAFNNAVGIVKVMGRNSGFIAMYSSLASKDVDCCLIPEIPFDIEYDHGVLHYIKECLHKKDKILIVVSEGAGQHYINDPVNKNLNDFGIWLCEVVRSNVPNVCIKYIDPTYTIRAITPNASDSIYCTILAQSAVHGAFCGYTNFIVGPVNGKHAYIPLQMAIHETNTVSEDDRMWFRLISANGQPSFVTSEQIE